ncbi:hypothetical protein PTSG_04461 [Salpingoeca rosetta]|uniref:Serine incorporator n=1 Tax=Salpingoeca rosetta (strain ATCC 50818 / BSB-021) TaxID=946362 RepID=F2U8M4_SALR5|nr:uncharacterized protein PTSG_04461 [Salpingoeca rosetta]EGD72732.1 hypothetical protein PTSG_04461 [Salpingoeca rosetta]|eukprot:XP_004994555.1 hypothetical protein PTSG_04461 [Salpingoeca rosetta]
MCSITSCLSSAACCLCSSSCGRCGSATMTRVGYALLLLLSAVCGWIFLNPKVSSDLQKMDKYVGHICKGNENCDRRWGELGVYRVLTATAVFHALMALILIGVKSSRDPRAAIHKGFWPVKLLLLIALATGAFFIPNGVFMDLGWVALVCGFLFIIVQMVLLVDFAYSWNEAWLGRMEDGSSCYKWGLITCSFGAYAIAIAITVCCFVFYTQADNNPCTLSKTALGVNIGLSLIMTFFALHPRVQEAQPTSGLLQAGIMSFYTTYLVWSAVSNVDEPCGMGVKPDTTATVVGAILTFLAVAYSSMRTSSASQLGKLGMQQDASERESLILSDVESGGGDDDDSSGGGCAGGDDEADGVKYSWSFFHLTFMMAAFYLMMVITDWANIRDGHTANEKVGNGLASVWIQIASSWVVALLYIWTLIAPLCLPNRDFS